MECQLASGSAIARQVQPALNTNKIPARTFSIANGGRPLFDLGGFWDLTYYGCYRLGQLRHEREKIGTKVHPQKLTKPLLHRQDPIYKHTLV